MIIDCHTRLWSDPRQLGPEAAAVLSKGTPSTWALESGEDEIDVFKDFDIRLGQSDHPDGTGLNGWQLIRSDMTENGLARHIDAKRPACITFPLTFPQSINFHESKESDILYTYEYKPVITILNSGSKWHSVNKNTEPRLQFQFDCYNSWEEIKELIENLSLT